MVLQPLSLQIDHGEHIALVGKSGVGKSTLLKQAFSSLTRSPALRRDEIPAIAFLPQELGLVTQLSVFHNVYMARLARYRRLTNFRNFVWPQLARLVEIDGLLAELDIADRLHSPVASLSGGQKQRVAVARALYQEADVLLADEPCSALDGPQADNVLQLLTTRFTASIIALHDVELALRHATRVIGLRAGAVALDQSAANLRPADLEFLYE